MTKKEAMTLFKQSNHLDVSEANFKYCSTGLFRYAKFNFEPNIPPDEKFILLTENMYLVLEKKDFTSITTESEYDFQVKREYWDSFKELGSSYFSQIRSLVKRYEVNRDRGKAKEVKDKHENICQICNEAVILNNGARYAEAHHIIPLGIEHNGPDELSNLICVCPNCHAKMDNFAVLISKRHLSHVDGHDISDVSIKYHNRLVGISRKLFP